MKTYNLAYWESVLIKAAMRKVNNNVDQACTLLGISRATLYRKLANSKE